MTLQLGTFGALFNPYLGLRNYVNNLLRHGFTAADVADGGSDRLIDALVLHGTPERINARLAEHLDAGANHVAVQVLTAPGEDPMPGYRELARTSPDAEHQGIAPRPQELARECRSQIRLERRSCLTEPPRHR
jgi:hypothetical protein